jgi:hypothetical protein
MYLEGWKKMINNAYANNSKDERNAKECNVCNLRAKRCNYFNKIC